jgi:hypothetical protein
VRVKRARDTKLFEATADFTRLDEPDSGVGTQMRIA